MSHDGPSLLYDAIVAAGQPAPGEARGAARAVVVLTDGQDTDSKLKLGELLDHLRQQASGEGAIGSSSPRLFTIAYGEKADAGVLKQLAEAGGGGFFSGTPKDIQSVYAEVVTFFEGALHVMRLTRAGRILMLLAGVALIGYALHQVQGLRREGREAFGFGFRPANPDVKLLSEDPTNPWNRLKPYGIHVDVPPVAETPSGEVTRLLLET